MTRLFTFLVLAAAALLPLGCGARRPKLVPIVDDGKWFLLKKVETELGPHHLTHLENFGPYVAGTYNEKVVEAIDRVQATAMDGGGYFIGIKADPPESPIGYPLELLGAPLLAPPRRTSYCSGASYTVLIEALNLIHADKRRRLSDDRAESLRMQEPDGGRREDGIKFWGRWNDDGFGSQFALVQYSGMGTEIKPANARPGDFMNITWAKGGGHAVVFLGWDVNLENGQKSLLYWSSQKGTNGLGDQLVPLENIKVVKIVRLTNPEALYTFDPATVTTRKVPGDKISL